MQPGQLSIWVTVGVAVLGIVGVVAGQLINAWREDRRWRRDQEREDLRWRREKEREDEKARRSTIEYWRERRIDLYAEFLLEQLKLQRLFAGLRHGLARKDAPAQAVTLIDDVYQQAQSIVRKIQIGGSAEVFRAAAKTFNSSTEIFAVLVRWHQDVREGSAVGEVEAVQQFQALMGVAEKDLEDFVRLARTSIGADRPELLVDERLSMELQKLATKNRQPENPS